MRIGAKGDTVRQLQQKLNAAGAKPKLALDADFGQKTKDAVIAFQRKHGISAIGIAGPRTMAALTAQDNPNRISKADFERAAKALGVSVAAVAAVAEVESAGSGFLPDGRPVILYERHIFHRQAKADNPKQAKDWASKYANLCNPRRGGYAGGSAEHHRLNSAKTLNPHWAQEACSWGMFQIMGFHWQQLGYASVTDMVQDMQRSEGAQLDALVRFIKADKKLHQAMLDCQWATFARIYNGPAFEENLYDVKLSRSYAQFVDVYTKDTPAPCK
ncbi:N-acetylmuramidase domain-containing protein [Motilimonas sp. 1_MG-2023]|uniref:N-acetylmuramidase domain-containing protein n=1 Tax=Motilimonas sp. 1_MG-2023 TaxID=3062672 RepID=UPI0026E158A6|nr:N-acetylmuramidase domain-containing protein [Motilimonas sp. 1_MG-2023]MDO6525443.1 N-acetylmuramidase domain-containing protein [Motilimonas sp. 1_MG-2023]